MAGTVCPDIDITPASAAKLARGNINPTHDHAMTAFLFATPEELGDFLFDHARYNLEHRISWHHVMQEAYRTPQQGRVYREYLQSPEWQRKRQAVLNRAMRSFIVKPIIIYRRRDRYGRLIESIETEWKTICEHEGCANVAKDVHHYNYDRVGKERIRRKPEESKENDLIALCSECHLSLHDRQR